MKTKASPQFIEMMEQRIRDGEVICKSRAVQFGLPWYFTGRPCRNGHLAKRNTLTNHCRDCIKEKRRAKNQTKRKQELQNINNIPELDPITVCLSHGVLPHQQKIISRQEAIKAGLPWYYTGKKCKNGHLAKRNVHSCACRMCNRELTKRRKQKYHTPRKINVSELIPRTS